MIVFMSTRDSKCFSTMIALVSGDMPVRVKMRPNVVGSADSGTDSGDPDGDGVRSSIRAVS